MEIKNRGLLIVVSVLIVLVSLFVTDRISFSPIGTASAEVIGCNNYQQDPQGNPPIPREPPYGNCVIDGLALLN